VVTITDHAPNPSVPGQMVTVTFTVASAVSAPTGSVTVTVGGGSGSCTGTLTAGTGSCSLLLPGEGAVSLIAAYSGDSNLAPAVSPAVSHTVADVAISGLAAANSSPTVLGDVTAFTATISAGSNVTYQWSFGDGQTGIGANATHTYATAGSHTAILTATNGAGSVTASTPVVITGGHVICLPIVGRHLYIPGDGERTVAMVSARRKGKR